MDATNTNSSSYPNNSQPHSFSEWYSYDHDALPPAYLEVKAYELDSFTTGTGTSSSQLSGSSHRLSAFNKHQHSYIKVKMLDDTFDQLRFTYSISGTAGLEIWTGASDDATAPIQPVKNGWDFYGMIEGGSGTQLVNGSAGSVVYIHMYWEAKHENSFSFSNMYCQPRQ